LRTLQREKFEQYPVIVCRDAPFLVMILDHQWIVAECCPITSPNFSLLQFASPMNSLDKRESVIFNQPDNQLLVN
jgi:hypothetical protein